MAIKDPRFLERTLAHDIAISAYDVACNPASCKYCQQNELRRKKRKSTPDMGICALCGIPFPPKSHSTRSRIRHGRNVYCSLSHSSIARNKKKRA